MDHADRFRREVAAFEAAARTAAARPGAPAIVACPDWTMSDLVAHLGRVQRLVARVIADRMRRPPDPADMSVYELPDDRRGWPDPEHPPTLGPVPAGLVDWFAEGAGRLGTLFEQRDAADVAWTWSADHTVGFWARMQCIEAAVHRWDAQRAVGPPDPVDTELAADAVVQTFTEMAAFRRNLRTAPPGTGERFAFRAADTGQHWTVSFDGNDVTLVDGPGDVELAGTVSDLALFLWRRVTADDLTVHGDRAVLDRYFTLVPPV